MNVEKFWESLLTLLNVSVSDTELVDDILILVRTAIDYTREAEGVCKTLFLKKA